MPASVTPRRRALFLGIVLGASNLLFLGAGYALARIAGSPATEVDLAVTRDSVAAPAFYEMVFEQPMTADLHEALLPDPVTKVRPRPLYGATPKAGPHDVIGFRGQGAPSRADIVTIGDSQTYGWNVACEDNWPSQLASLTGRQVYNMALGGWGGAQYWYIAQKALRLSPRHIVVGLYMGNDSIESLTHVYKTPEFAGFRLQGHTTLSDFELRFERQAPEELLLPEGAVAFTPERRWFVNDRSNAAVTAGYGLLARFAQELAAQATAAGAAVTFLVVPTKETVYAPALRAAGARPSAMFDDLVRDEALNAADLVASLRSSNLQALDATQALQAAATEGRRPYPADADGHPNSTGHRILAEVAAGALSRAPASTPQGPR